MPILDRLVARPNHPRSRAQPSGGCRAATASGARGARPGSSPGPRSGPEGERMRDDRTLLRWTLSFLAPYRSRVVLLAVLLLAEVILGAMQPLLLKVVIDYVLIPNPIPEPFAGWLLAIHEGNPVVLLVTLVVAGVVIQVGKEIITAFSTQVQVETGQRMVYGLRYGLFEHLQTLGLH